MLPRPFLETLQARYTADTVSNEPTPDHESVLLGQSGIEVEAPNLAKVRKRLARLRELREIGVDNEGVGRVANGEGTTMQEMGDWSECHFSPHHGVCNSRSGDARSGRIA